MKTDYSFIETLFSVIAGGSPLAALEGTPALRTMSAHAALFGNRFGLDEIADAIQHGNERVYGFAGFAANRDRIQELSIGLKASQHEWLPEVEHHAGFLFPQARLDMITVCPVVGYDIGIGTKGVVCVNLNTGIFLENVRELVSLVIHETAHAAFEQASGPLLGIAGLGSNRAMRAFLDYYIQYEGYGLFAPAEYRSRHRLPDAGTPPQEDYRVAEDVVLARSLVREYQALVSDLECPEGLPLETFFQRGFGPSRLPHRLGYAIVDAVNRANSLRMVQAAVSLECTEFVERYLPLVRDW